MLTHKDQKPKPPKRGFPKKEYLLRLKRAQAEMQQERLDVILVTTATEICYFTGFLTQFFESPTRPWFVIVPLAGKPIAVIPEIGRAGMAQTWIDEIHTWPSPRPEDEGISLLASILNRLPTQFGRSGLPLGPESMLRMPMLDLDLLSEQCKSIFVDCASLLHRLRFIKSEAEVEKIRWICTLASDAFDHLVEYTHVGESEREICRRMQMDLLDRGADRVPYLVAGSGQGGYDSIIMGPSDRRLEAGDVMIIDTGALYDGYFCDFDRNIAFGALDVETQRAHETLYRATEAGLAAARPGATTGELWEGMWGILKRGGALSNNVGRMGHGLGMQLTEWPSIQEGGQTFLEPGVVITLEPGMEFAPGRQLVHEENILITEEGAELLTRRAPSEMIQIG
jgi:Xaa-Pro aminopeptidase